ncbi:hypothetical protein E2C01_003083 [Portunus trituberculatus]|uniref:Uncharacterized protein n=1 Tax=Portunus trituberculatus TaxID=210409 RepID=A0A5B7CLF0_PORTR|nr:hypothetical protein [Portunus trituberculatus]
MCICWASRLDLIILLDSGHLGVQGLDVFAELRKRRLRWFGHVRRAVGRVMSKVEEMRVGDQWLVVVLVVDDFEDQVGFIMAKHCHTRVTLSEIDLQDGRQKGGLH